MKAVAQFIHDFSRVEIGDYCLVVEDGRPTLGRVFEIPKGQGCVYYKWGPKGNEKSRGITDPAEALIFRASGDHLLALMGENALYVDPNSIGHHKHQ